MTIKQATNELYKHFGVCVLCMDYHDDNSCDPMCEEGTRLQAELEAATEE